MTNLIFFRSTQGHALRLIQASVFKSGYCRISRLAGNSLKLKEKQHFRISYYQNDLNSFHLHPIERKEIGCITLAQRGKKVKDWGYVFSLKGFFKALGIDYTAGDLAYDITEITIKGEKVLKFTKAKKNNTTKPKKNN